MRSYARILLLLAAFLAVLPIVHHHGPSPHREQGCEHGTGSPGSEHAEQSCVLGMLQKSTTVDAFPPAIAAPERLNEPTVAACAAVPRTSQLPRNLSPRAPPTV